ncbi:GNAT family N-acetyltransferase [Patescibacteria group bacterium]
MKIRPAKTSDATDLARINVTGWQKAYKDILCPDILKKQSIPERTKQFEQAIKDKTEETYILEDDGKMIGFTTIGASRDDDKNKNTGEIWGIYIDSKYWKQGYGRKLADYGEKILIKRGYKEIILWVLKENMASRKFYEKIGFKVEGKTQKLERCGNAEVIRYIKLIN